MGKGATAVWRTILQIALATMLIIGGCNVFFGNLWTKTTSSDELIKAVGSLFNGDLKNIVIKEGLADSTMVVTGPYSAITRDLKQGSTVLVKQNITKRK